MWGIVGRPDVTWVTSDPPPSANLIALADALERLAALNPRLSQVMECRFFGGTTEEETAAALGVTDRTVRRDWIKAKGYVHQALPAEAE